MDRLKLKRLIFMALCCDLGVFAKKLIVPAANILTDFLHIPGGVGTGFSLMFIVIAAAFCPSFGSATLMGAVQSVIALCMGTVGSMGALSPIGYIVPAFAVDCVLFVSRKLSKCNALVIANTVASVIACLIANAIVFRLRGIVLLLYACVSLTSGAVCGALAESAAEKLAPVFGKDERHEKKAHNFAHSRSCGADCNSCGHTSDNAHA